MGLGKRSEASERVSSAGGDEGLGQGRVCGGQILSNPNRIVMRRRKKIPLKRQVADRIRQEDHDKNQTGDQWAKNDATRHEVKVAVKVRKDEHRWDNGK